MRTSLRFRRWFGVILFLAWKTAADETFVRIDAVLAVWRVR